MGHFFLLCFVVMLKLAIVILLVVMVNIGIDAMLEPQPPKLEGPYKLLQHQHLTRGSAACQCARNHDPVVHIGTPLSGGEDAVDFSLCIFSCIFDWTSASRLLTVNVTWGTSCLGRDPCPTSLLGFGTGRFLGVGSPGSGTLVPAPERIQDGVSVDINPDLPELQVFINKNVNFYTGTDGNPGSQQDLVTLLMHELSHAYGFTGAVFQNGANQAQLQTTDFLADFDSVMTQGLNTDNFVIRDYFGNQAGFQSAANSFIVSNNVFFDSAQFASCGGTRLYAPTLFANGSSLYHVDNIYQNTVDELMTFQIFAGDSIQDPGPRVRDVFTTIGYTIDPNFPGPNNCPGGTTRSLVLPRTQSLVLLQIQSLVLLQIQSLVLPQIQSLELLRIRLLELLPIRSHELPLLRVLELQLLQEHLLVLQQIHLLSLQLKQELVLLQLQSVLLQQPALEQDLLL